MHPLITHSKIWKTNNKPNFILILTPFCSLQTSFELFVSAFAKVCLTVKKKNDKIKQEHVQSTSAGFNNGLSMVNC
jgi:hypothetical protein